MTKSLHIRNFSAAWFLTLFLLVNVPCLAQTHPTRVLLVSIADRKLAVIEDGAVKNVYPVAVGKNSTPGPTGSTDSCGAQRPDSANLRKFRRCRCAWDSFP